MDWKTRKEILKGVWTAYRADNKGVSGLLVAGLLLVATVVGLGIGGQVLGTVQNGQTANSAAWNVSNNGLSALNTFGTYLPTIALVIVLGVIIGYLFSSGIFGMGRGGRGGSY